VTNVGRLVDGAHEKHPGDPNVSFTLIGISDGGQRSAPVEDNEWRAIRSAKGARTARHSLLPTSAKRHLTSVIFRDEVSPAVVIRQKYVPDAA
jgi:hypothetical protein